MSGQWTISDNTTIEGETIDIDGISMPFTDFIDAMKKMGEENNLDIRTMHEDIFNSMHRI